MQHSWWSVFAVQSNAAFAAWWERAQACHELSMLQVDLCTTATFTTPETSESFNEDFSVSQVSSGIPLAAWNLVDAGRDASICCQRTLQGCTVCDGDLFASCTDPSIIANAPCLHTSLGPTSVLDLQDHDKHMFWKTSKSAKQSLSQGIFAR